MGIGLFSAIHRNYYNPLLKFVVQQFGLQDRNLYAELLLTALQLLYLNQTFESIIITARTTSYLLTNNAIHNTLQNIKNHLNEKGVFCFDFIDANRFFPIIKDGKTIIHEAEIHNKVYSRTSFMKPTIKKENFMFQWNANYYKIEGEHKTLITEDQSVVRAFTRKKWQLFLE